MSKDILIDDLSNDGKAVKYLQASLEQYARDNDEAVFLRSMRNIVESRGGIDYFADQCSIASGDMYKYLFGEEPITLNVFLKMIYGMWWDFSVHPIEWQE